MVGFEQSLIRAYSCMNPGNHASLARTTFYVMYNSSYLYKHYSTGYTVDRSVLQELNFFNLLLSLVVRPNSFTKVRLWLSEEREKTLNT